MSFVHLHVHSEYSLLDGFSNIKKLVARAKEMEMPAVGLTDHGTMFGTIDFYNAATKAGIKPIIGIESYMAARRMQDRDPQLDKRSTHLLLLAENQTGYQNLLQIASAAQLEGFYYYPRIDHEFLAAHSEGLIATSGCMSAEVPRMIQNGNLEGARKRLDWYYEVFGKDNFFLELQAHDIKELEDINKHLIALGSRYNSHFVATNDVHYVDQEDARYQDIMLAIQTGCVISDPNRMRMTDNSYYLRSPQEMASLFSHVPGALENTLLIAERCSVDLRFKSYHLPEFEVPTGYDAEGYLRKLCEDGLKRRYGSRADDARVRERLDFELGVIHQMGFDAYFLIVWDLCQHAEKNGIWYNARGSAAGSIVAYTLGITKVDPLEHGLIFERFLNPGRVSMPDIDMDFPDDRRAELMTYCADKYGDDKVAQIITFGTLGARAAIRDVGRVLDIPLTEVDKVAKLVPNIPGKPVKIKEALEEITEFKQLYQQTPYLRELIDTAVHMEGVVRNAGTHAAGVIITDRPIIEYIPLHRPTGSANESPIKTVTQFEMSVLDALGLLKVDFLGLSTLTIMARACEMIRQRHGIEFDLDNIPVDDPETFELLGRGETAGVFQVEGSGMRRWLMQMKPQSLANVVAMVALFRPGPMDFIPGYIRRMHGEEAIEYRHPALEVIFKETYGYPVYQEQLMFAAMDLAGYTAAEADGLRKAIAKKKKEQLEMHREKFIAGAVQKGIAQDTAQAIFADWEEFARYGFNKSHAVVYGVMSVQTAYLKAHYPVEYMTALLSVYQDNTDKVTLYVADCRRMGIDILPPDVNHSGWDFTIEDHPDGSSHIRFGLGAIKNVGQGPVEAILEGRKDGPFEDLNDFARRTDLRQVGKRALESLVKVGALDGFGQRIALLEALDRVIAVSTSHFRAVESGQMSLFGAHTGVVEEIQLPEASGEISRREILNWERELIGLYVSDHPLSPIMQELTEAVSHFSGQLAEAGHREKVRVAGLVTRIRHHQTKSGKPMAFATIEDLQGNIELVIFPRTWAKFQELVQYDNIILVDGNVDAEGGEPKVLVDEVTDQFSMVTPLNVPPSLPAWEYAPESLEDEETDLEDPEPVAPQAASEIQSGGRHHREPGPAALEDWEGNGPPPPDVFPPGWEEASEPNHEAVLEEDRAGSSPPGAGSLSSRVQTAPEKTAKTEARPRVSTAAFTEAPEWEYDFTNGALDAELEALRVARESAGGAEAAAVSQPPEAEPQAVERALAVRENRPALQVEEPALRADPVESAEQPVRSSTESEPRPAVLAVERESGAELQDKPVRPVYLAADQAEADDESVRMITVTLRSTGDKTRDVLRLRRIHGIITSYPGRDSFAFQVYERGRGYRLEFPNFKAGICPEMLDRLHALVGRDNVLVEPVVYQ